MNTVDRSTFVTAVAWTFIALSGCATAMSILQNIMIQVLFDHHGMGDALRTLPPGAPPWAGFMVGHIRLFFLAFLLASGVMLAASIGLLRRRNWARRVFVGLMALGIAWNACGLVLQFRMAAFMRSTIAHTPGAPDMQPFLVAVVAMSAIIAIGLSALFAWIARRLLSPATVAEFQR